MRHTDL